MDTGYAYTCYKYVVYVYGKNIWYLYTEGIRGICVCGICVRAMNTCYAYTCYKYVVYVYGKNTWYVYTI